MDDFLSDAAREWMVDGKLYPGTADEVVTYFDKRAAYWTDKTQRKSQPSARNGHESGDLQPAPEKAGEQ